MAHDRGRFEVVCYSDVSADEVTERLRGLADQWHDVTKLSTSSSPSIFARIASIDANG